MEKSLLKVYEKLYSTYFDGLFLFVKSMYYVQGVAQFLEHLTMILCALRKAKLKIKLSKSISLQQEVFFLGHLESVTSIYPDPSKVEDNASFPRPKKQKMCNHFRARSTGFIASLSKMAEIAQPLYSFTSKGNKEPRGNYMMRPSKSLKILYRCRLFLAKPLNSI